MTQLYSTVDRAPAPRKQRRLGPRLGRRRSLLAIMLPVLIASACGPGDQDGVTVAPPAAVPSPSPDSGNSEEHEAAAVADPSPSSDLAEPTEQQATADYPDDTWWSDDLEELGAAMDDCRTGTGPWSDQECQFMGGIGASGQFGPLIKEYQVDLVASGYQMCRQMDQRPTPEAFAAGFEPPDGWPSPSDEWPPLEGDVVLWTFTASAAQTLCPQHLALAGSLFEVTIDESDD